MAPGQADADVHVPDADLDPAQCGGDLVIQLSAGHADAILQALRDIARPASRNGPRTW